MRGTATIYDCREDLSTAARDLARLLREARLKPERRIALETQTGLLVVTADKAGEPLERLADAVFQPALEMALRRYIVLLERIAAGESFPSGQLSR